MGPRRIGELDRLERRRALVRTAVRAVGTTVALVVVYYLAPIDEASGDDAFWWLVGGLVAFFAVLGWQVRQILRADLPELRAVVALATIVPFFLIVFAVVSLSLSTADASAYNERLTHTTALYFVIVVFGTVGFGDIAPKSDPARLVASVQVILDLAVIGVILQLLVHAARRNLPSDAGDG